MPDPKLIEDVAREIYTANHVTVLTGAGVSKESGVPTFRDALDGLWAKYDPQQLATPQAFKRDPKLVWDWYEYRRKIAREAKPNPGHIALAQLEQFFPSLEVITQNVDDLHEQAGSSTVIHLHGNIARNKCFRNCQGVSTLVDISDAVHKSDDEPPHCPHCDAYIRPDVVWFGESLPSQAFDRAVTLSERCDVMLVVGTSGMVHPAASLPLLAIKAGAIVVEVNPVDTAISGYARYKLRAPSGEVLPIVLQHLQRLSDA